MKRLLSIAIMITVAIFAMAQPDSFRKTVQGVDYHFKLLDDNTVAISFAKPVAQSLGVNGNMLSLPTDVQLDGYLYKVIAISDSAFAGCVDLQRIVIPTSVVFIGDGAFAGCDNLRTLTLSCDSLGFATGAFSGCSFDTIVISNSVRMLPAFLFSDLKGLKYVDFQAEYATKMSYPFFGCRMQAVLHIGSNVVDIPENVFYYFIGLQQVVFDSDCLLKTIGENSFVSCSNLSTIVMPASLERVGEGAFSYCSPTHLIFSGKRPPYLASTSFMGVDKQVQVFIPCHTLGLYARSSVGNMFPNLVYSEDCISSNSNVEVIYIRDTVFVHDTIILPNAFASPDFPYFTMDTIKCHEAVETEEETEEENGEQIDWIIIDGQQLIIRNATTLRGVSVRVFDDKGKLVIDQLIPRSQMTDSYKIKLPEKRRYFLRLDMGKPYLIDVPSQNVKE